MEQVNRYIPEEEWCIDHLVVLRKSNKVLVACRRSDRCDLLFLVDQCTGSVYIREPDGSWNCLAAPEGRTVIAHMVAARNRDVLVYSAN